eukprot:scaffold88174_cov57-Attheya_sp.AAC.4
MMNCVDPTIQCLYNVCALWQSYDSQYELVVTKKICLVPACFSLFRFAFFHGPIARHHRSIPRSILDTSSLTTIDRSLQTFLGNFLLAPCHHYFFVTKVSSPPLTAIIISVKQLETINSRSYFKVTI